MSLEKRDENLYTVRSPAVGNFYRIPVPGEVVEILVGEGSGVEYDQSRFRVLAQHW